MGTGTSKLSSMKGINLSSLGPTSSSPHSSIIEMKTCSSRSPPDWRESYIQLYLSQTPYLYLARHNDGIFAPPEKYALNGDMEVHTRNAQQGIAMMVEVLKAVVEIARQGEEGTDRKSVV